MKVKCFILSILSIIIFSQYANTQTTLSTGDIAIIGIRTDNPDDFSFVLLVDIASSTVINFTDNAWISSSNAFRTGEGTATFTSSTAYSAGTVISYSGNSSEFSTSGSFVLSTSGDQVLAYQGSSGSPTFIFAAQTNSLNWQTGSTLSSKTSNLPSGLTDGGTAVAVGSGSGDTDEWDDAWYSGISTGSKEDLLASIADQSNWSGDNSAANYSPLSSFTVTNVNNPASFSAQGSSSTQIDLSATANTNNDTIMVAYNSTNTFGTPSGTYSAGNTISGGGTVHFWGLASSLTNHTGLSSGQTVYYEAWSYDGSSYSSGVTDNATTFKAEPTNHVLSFTTGTVSASSIPLTWSDNDGTVVADNYLIIASSTSYAAITNPVDGTAQTDETDLSDGSGVVNVAHGSEAYNSWLHMNSGTTYFFKIFPYTNSGSAIDYKTDGTIPQANGTTTTSYSNGSIIITEIMKDPSSVADTKGEWFEIFNTTLSDIDINSWTISDNGSDSHTISNGGSLYIPAQDFLTLGRNSTTSTNGGVTIDYQYSGFILGNSDDEIILKDDSGNTIDSIAYDNGIDWAEQAGVSLQFIGLETDDNNDGANWELASFRENGFDNSQTDLGSPGTNGIGQNLYDTTTWTGTNNWADGNAPGNSNWSKGSPGSQTDVIIDGIITVSNNVNCDNLSVKPEMSITISSGYTLEVNGDLTLDCNSNTDAPGSLIDNGTLTVNGTSKFKRYLPVNDWQYVSIPVGQGTGATSSSFIPSSGYAYLRDFTDGDDWGDYIYATNYQLEVMKGYIVYLTGTKTVEFTGSFNTGSQSYSPVYTGTNFCFTGNPYPSAIDWEASSGWTRTNVSDNFWVWNHSVGNYGVYLLSGGSGTATNNATQYIPASQAFFIKTTAASPAFAVTNDVRVHNTQTFYKTQSFAINQLNLTVEGNEGEDEIIIRFDSLATDSIDVNLDIEKMFGASYAPQLFSVNNNENLSINTLSALTTNVSVPVSITVGEPGIYSIFADNLESFASGTSIIIEDLLTSTFIDLVETEGFSFNVDTADVPERFIVHFSPIITDIEKQAKPIVNIYSYDNSIYLRARESIDGLVEVYNLGGQNIISKKMDSYFMKIDMHNNNGYFLVRFISDKETVTKKLFINK